MKVLIVDDEDDVLKMYGEKLVAEGFEVVTADDGQDGLEKAQKEKPDVVLLDIIMPKFNGLDVLKILKSQEDTKSIPVYLLTNLPQEASGEKAKELGASGYLVKYGNEPATVAAFLKGLEDKK